MSAASATVKPRTGTQATVTDVLMADSSSQVTVAVRGDVGADRRVVSAPVQVVVAPRSGAGQRHTGMVTVSGVSASLPVLVMVAV